MIPPPAATKGQANMTDDEIDREARGFCDLTLPRAEWTHAAHFATALWLILTQPITGQTCVLNQSRVAAQALAAASPL
jgi:hypothetical protein